jgi:hypothetical protein
MCKICLITNDVCKIFLPVYKFYNAFPVSKVSSHFNLSELEVFCKLKHKTESFKLAYRSFELNPCNIKIYMLLENK